MFDNMIIVEDSLKNTDEGFSLLARLPYYRGLGLSMVEDIAVTIDGVQQASENIVLAMRGKSWTLQQMESEYSDRWNFGEKAEVRVNGPSLSGGEHEVMVAIRMRVSYLPFVPTTACTKRMTAEV